MRMKNPLPRIARSVATPVGCRLPGEWITSMVPSCTPKPTCRGWVPPRSMDGAVAARRLEPPEQNERIMAAPPSPALRGGFVRRHRQRVPQGDEQSAHEADGRALVERHRVRLPGEPRCAARLEDHDPAAQQACRGAD